jgi:hypothetical protein
MGGEKMPWIQTGLYIIGSIAAAAAVLLAGAWTYHNGRTAKILREEFISIADTYSGLYEPLYLMCNGSIKYRPGILGDWAVRTENLKSAPHYREIWNRKLNGCTQWNADQGLKKLEELIGFILTSEIFRDTAKQIIVDNTTYKKYETADDELIEEGQSAQVKNAYWFTGEKILEKGMIEKID